MPTINYEKKAVAFVDVLGFASLVNSSVISKAHKLKLEALVDVVSSAVPALDQKVSTHIPHHLIPRHTYISDCIILSAPLVDGELSFYNGLEVVVMRCIQLTHRLLEMGYLLRGGIAVGSVWHCDHNIVGPAYQEACSLERSTEKPRIALAKSALKHWAKPFDEGSNMCLKYDGVCMVNGIHDYYIADNLSYEGVQKELAKYIEIIGTNLANLEHNHKAWDKWKWFEGFLNDQSSK